jgi:2-phospho-L-lactate guanylyltransferase
MPDNRTAALRGAIVIPVKAFERAKERLAGTLSPDERVALARRTAARVVATAVALPQFDSVVVVCDDEATAAWARAEGAEVIIAPEPGLNAAVTHAVAAVRARHEWVAVCHADVADPAGLATIAAPPRGTVTLVPDRHGTGTNVLVIDTNDGFTFHYGPTSLTDHRAEAERRGLAVRIVNDAGLALDLDTPADVALFDEA